MKNNLEQSFWKDAIRTLRAEEANKSKAKTKVFFDTEFTGLHQNTTLISIGLVAETGESFYAELTDFNKQQVTKWLSDNVLNNLLLDDMPNVLINRLIKINKYISFISGCKESVEKELRDWLSQFEEVEMWSDCLNYDWTLFRDLMQEQLPKNVSYIPLDICTLFWQKGIDPDISRVEFAEMDGEQQHNALFDAFVIKKCFEKLEEM